MSTNHNRIRVADLETNQQNKILTTNSAGELEFTDINTIQIDSYNALDYTSEGKALDARQGKVLKDLTDKKVDKVNGKNLLSDAEITRLGTLSNYTHPTNHAPSIITQDTNNRFVTDAEKATWNAKLNAGNHKTYFVNNLIGNNSTGVFQDSTKPFSTLDFVLSIPNLTDGTIIILQNEGVFPINVQIPQIYLTIKSNYKVTIDISANSNTLLITPSISILKILTIDIPYGTFRNNRSGGEGISIIGHYKQLSLRANELYWYSSTGIGYSDVFLDLKIKIIQTSCKNLFQNVPGIGNIGIIEKLICLGNDVDLGLSGLNIYIQTISGIGFAKIANQNRYFIGDISTTGTSLITGYAYVEFLHSTITSNGGINFGDGYHYATTITGSIKSTAQIASKVVSENGVLKIINFSGNFGSGYLSQFAGSIIIENSNIVSNSSPIKVTAKSSTPITLKNSTFEMAIPAPLVDCITGQTRTLKLGGISTNATEISQSGTGITIIKLTNY